MILLLLFSLLLSLAACGGGKTNDPVRVPIHGYAKELADEVDKTTLPSEIGALAKNPGLVFGDGMATIVPTTGGIGGLFPMGTGLSRDADLLRHLRARAVCFALSPPTAFLCRSRNPRRQSQCSIFPDPAKNTIFFAHKAGAVLPFSVFDDRMKSEMQNGEVREYENGFRAAF